MKFGKIAVGLLRITSVRIKHLSLRTLNLRDEYRSDNCQLIQDFYVPCLEQATLYSRAVGFFSSTSMAAAANGLTVFIRTGGRMRLVASPNLSEEDAMAIAAGLRSREEAITIAIVRELDQTIDNIVCDRLACLAWLLSQEILDIKLVIPRNIKNRGIYHEKLGLFADREGNIVAFTGSANESSNALVDNFECIDVYTSWEPGVQQRAQRKAEHFERLWHDATPNVEVIEFPEAARRSLLKLRPEQPPTREPRAAARSAHYQTLANSKCVLPQTIGVPSLPVEIVLRPYQEQAIANWFANKGRGTLKMATGSGKTITALAIATELFRTQQLQLLIIVCPYRHLVTQWDKECRRFGLNPILAFENIKAWQGKLSSQLYALRAEQQSFLTVITTNATLLGQGFQSQLAYFPKKTLIVGDEAHNLGATRLAQSLPQSIPFRLALSATPERYFDESGTQVIYDYFGAVLEPEFTLSDAITQGALVHYLYYPILVELTESESQRYIALSTKIRRLIGMGEPDDENPALTPLLMERSRLVGSAANKLEALRELMGDRLDTTHTLFYCGDGTVEDSALDTNERQLAAVARLLGRELGYRINTYTADTPLEERADLHDLFESGELQGLVAIRCLDEGIDIPATQTAVILASSNNPRQFVQRRGRILRPHPHKQRATLFDMIVVPPALDRATFEMERQLLRTELIRFVEFADLADNAGEARLKLLALQQQYDLLDL
jgi:DNA phosphorothioation system restriction enzyme